MTLRRKLGVGLGGAAALGSLLATVAALQGQGSAPLRCPGGFAAGPTRCCPLLQAERGGRCVGELGECPPGFTLAPAKGSGCVMAPRRIHVAGGTLELGPVDWEGAGNDRGRRITVGDFALDASEVTNEEWRPCARGAVCRPLGEAEPGLPVVAVSVAEAATYCRFAGGRLPRGDEWVFAAAGATGRRYPWGGTGLVCRRAAFGLVAGPCARGGGPELAGLRPDGATPEGLQDLAGNVAEWTLEPGGDAVARGGSFASRFAGELKSWAAETPPGPVAHVGFRCAYDP